MEEHWGEPYGPSLTGTSRWTRRGEVHAYELLCLERAGSDTFLRIRRFAPGLVPPDSEQTGPLPWRLVRHEGRGAGFGDESRVFPRRR